MIYDTALYLRLSRDDTDIDGIHKTESNSISSQRELLRAYVHAHEELRIFDIYIDDGYSGADFDRPEFQRMMEDIRSGYVNCVIVKDLSRFGRDYIEAGRLIQKTFPAFCVRFIAVTDHYDSLSADEAEQGLVLPIKNFVNDSYCRDISSKVRAQQHSKRLEGKCIAAFAVYGYRKAPDDKNRLVIDDLAAGIVRNIFAWKMAGMSLGAIADGLNAQGILSPLEYKRALGMKYTTGFERAEMASWSATAVRRILTDRVYIGYMEQGKREKLSYKLQKRVIKPETEWIRVKNTHEAIISENDFFLVQELLRVDGRRSRDSVTTSLFSGILLCADCKRPMIKRVNTYRGRKKVFYICQTKNKSLGCSRHSISEEVLQRIVCKEIQAWTAFDAGNMTATGRGEAAAAAGKQADTRWEQIGRYEELCGRLRAEYQKYEGLQGALSADWRAGLLEWEEFDELHIFYTKKCAALSLTIQKQEKLIQKLRQDHMTAKVSEHEYQESRCQAGKAPDMLSRELLVRLIRKIYVHEGRELDLFFRFSKEPSQ